MLAFVFVVSLLAAGRTLVSGLNFTLSKTRIIVGTTGKLFMTCQITDKDVLVLYNIQIRRETDSGWQTIAHIEAGVTEVPALDKEIVDDKGFIVGGILDKENPLNTHITLEMNIENMTYDDARVYRCEMTYKSNVSGSIFSIEKNATLIIVVSGLNFTLSKTRVIVGTTIELLMTCQITEVDVVVYHMAIRRETNSGWQTMAHIEAGVTEVPALNNDIVDDKGFIVGGTLDKENPLNTHITLEMNIEKMTYDDARVYRFEMTYKSNVSGSIFSIEKNATLIIVGADNKTEEQTGTLQNSECVSKTTSVIVGVILGVVIILTTVYASYLTVVIRRIKDRNQHCARCIMLEATSTNDRREIQNSSDEI